MLETVTLPVWLFVLILVFASVTAASHFFIPSVRWFLRRRLERAVARLNARLERPIEPFKLMARQDMILRLAYDPEILAAVADRARETGVREDVAHAEARAYAREIVPAFSAFAYFGVAIRVARWLSTRLYHVRMTPHGHEEISAIDPDATVVFVINHRSNMDYVLVTWLAAERSALSYAVGEWARIWPVSRLLRGMGAYFIRRRSRNDLYRRVLARYVQMAVAGGVTQAIFPEGGLSVDGRVRTPRLGLLSYIVEGWTPEGRDVVFVPVSLNYDRVIEDKVLIEARRSGDRRFRGSFATGAAFAARWLWRRATGQARRFGYAAVAFGPPLSMRAAGGMDVADLGRELMRRIRCNMPLLPGPLVAAALLDGARSREEVVAWLDRAVPGLQERGIWVHLRRNDTAATAASMIDMLILRGLLAERDGRLRVGDGAEEVLSFYAASVSEHHAAMQETAPCHALGET